MAGSTAGHDVTVSDSGERDVRLLQEALMLELQAVQRYLDHVSGSTDPRLVAYWESLRRNESDHRDELMRQLAARGSILRVGEDKPRDVNEGGPFATMKERGPTDGSQAPDLDAPREGFRSALEALAADVEFERRAIRTYSTAAVRAADPAVRELFRELTRGESGHAKGLRAVIRRISHLEWPVILFCPLCGWEIDLSLAPIAGRPVRCPMCPGRFTLRLEAGDWSLERFTERRSDSEEMNER